MALTDILFSEGDNQEFIVELPEGTLGTPNDILYDSNSNVNEEIGSVQISSGFVF